MLLALTDDKSTLVQIMAWCRQATSYYLSQCWWRSLSPYGVTRPQWVKNVICKMAAILFQAGCVPRCRWSFAFVLYRTDSRFGSSQWASSLAGRKTRISPVVYAVCSRDYLLVVLLCRSSHYHQWSLRTNTSWRHTREAKSERSASRTSEAEVVSAGFLIMWPKA